MNQSKRLILAGCLVINDKKQILLLLRKDHNHYETPGGKVNPDDCENADAISINDLAKTAESELYEELGNHITVSPLSYFASIEFRVPDGRLATANKFLTRIISGKPIVNEPSIFERFDFLPISNLENYELSPDLKLLLPRIKFLLSTNT